jgi:hypothetical protein
MIRLVAYATFEMRRPSARMNDGKEQYASWVID